MVLDVHHAQKETSMNTSPYDPFQGRAVIGIKDAARALDICPSAIYRMLRDKEIKSILIGRRRVIPVAEIRAFLIRVSGDETVWESK